MIQEYSTYPEDDIQLRGTTQHTVNENIFALYANVLFTPLKLVCTCIYYAVYYVQNIVPDRFQKQTNYSFSNYSRTIIFEFADCLHFIPRFYFFNGTFAITLLLRLLLNACVLMHFSLYSLSYQTIKQEGLELLLSINESFLTFILMF